MPSGRQVTSPESVTIGRGFVVTQDSCSTQIDVLVYDNSMPILYRDGDLVFVTPSACRGIVEVKSSTSARQFKHAVVKLADNAEFIRKNCADYDLFVGLFAYDFYGRKSSTVLAALADAAMGDPARIVNHVSLGTSKFIKFWRSDPNVIEGIPINDYRHWRLYHLERMAPGYFIHNLLRSVSRNLTFQRDGSWFPNESKEVYVEDELLFVTPTS